LLYSYSEKKAAGRNDGKKFFFHIANVGFISIKSIDTVLVN
jgi:hypothetical protein